MGLPLLLLPGWTLTGLGSQIQVEQSQGIGLESGLRGRSKPAVVIEVFKHSIFSRSFSLRCSGVLSLKTRHNPPRSGHWRSPICGTLNYEVPQPCFEAI